MPRERQIDFDEGPIEFHYKVDQLSSYLPGSLRRPPGAGAPPRPIEFTCRAIDDACRPNSTKSLSFEKIEDEPEPIAPRAARSLARGGGAAATKQAHNLDRHWRNVRTLASHNPTVYKARAIGEHAINGTPLPANGFF
ncbi:MAG: hypothetical protein ACLP0J_18665 [Solirubrobacteraceae bacterium]